MPPAGTWAGLKTKTKLKNNIGQNTHHDKRHYTTLHKERPKDNNIAWQEHNMTTTGLQQLVATCH
jgi:hypothetical protein